MKSERWLWKERVGIVCVILTILSLSLTLTINSRFLYNMDIDFLHILDYVSLDKKTVLKNYGELMAYLNNPFTTTLDLSNFPVSESGAFHFYQVKQLFLICYTVLFLTGIPSIFFIRSLSKHQRLWRLVRPFQWGMIVPVFLVFLMALGFDQFFISFHQILFRNTDWLFDPRTDPIINILPETYFMHCFILFFIILEFFFLVGIVIGKRELTRKKNKKNQKSSNKSS